MKKRRLTERFCVSGAVARGTSCAEQQLLWLVASVVEAPPTQKAANTLRRNPCGLRRNGGRLRHELDCVKPPAVGCNAAEVLSENHYN
jgi:hypothetical protein